MNKPLWFRVLRVEQYAKNGFVLLPLFFSGNALQFSILRQSLLMCLTFCAAASVVYIVNDMLDIHEDRNHPTKKHRPLASGQIAMLHAGILAFGLFCIACSIAAYISLACLGIIIAYLALNAFYVFYAKHHSLLDVACIALGFVLRTLSGGLAIAVPISHWLILMVFLLCMFLALGKRWDDLCITEKGTTTGIIRTSLKSYTKTFIVSSMTFLSTVNTVCYILYTVNPQTILQYQSAYLYLTSCWVVLGNLRYLQLAFVKEACASPTRIFLHDRGIQACVLLWLVHLAWLIYYRAA